MISQELAKLELCMKEPWHREYGTFLMIPAFATLACHFIPIFHVEQGLSSMALFPLTGACSLGIFLAPRKTYYEISWQNIMDFPSFILGSVKKTLLFGIPTGLAAWIASSLLNGYTQELVKIFEVIVWGLVSGICLYSLAIYPSEVSKIRKTDEREYKSKMTSLWRWIVPSVIVSYLLTISKIHLLLN